MRALLSKVLGLVLTGVRQCIMLGLLASAVVIHLPGCGKSGEHQGTVTSILSGTRCAGEALCSFPLAGEG